MDSHPWGPLRASAPVRPSALGLLRLFVREASTSFRQMGTFLPAQRHLARKVSEAVPRRDGVTIMELGAGEGCLTRAIVRQLDGLAYRFLVIELSRPLIEANRQAIGVCFSLQEDPAKRGRLHFLQGDALAFESTLRQLGLSRVDAVVSSLPLQYFSCKQRLRLFRSVRNVLGQEGVFVQYRYTPRGVAELSRYFGQVRRRFVLNVLPAWLFVCNHH